MYIMMMIPKDVKPIKAKMGRKYGRIGVNRKKIQTVSRSILVCVCMGFKWNVRNQKRQ
jgi:hypothetical protein